MADKRYRRNELSPNYKHGIMSEGYKRINVGGIRLLEQQFVIAQLLGRPLAKGEVVHHRNGDKLDNRLENLELVSRKEHNYMHSNTLVNINKYLFFNRWKNQWERREVRHG